EVFADVTPALVRWKEAGNKIAIFSSGSVLAQKLLFAHTNERDLTKFFGHYFDTTILEASENQAAKLKPESYLRIASKMGFPPSEILFISDVTTELDAADTAGIKTLLVVRPANLPQPDKQEHEIIHSFDKVVKIRAMPDCVIRGRRVVLADS